MSELQVFRMCFPEKFIVKVLIPATNKVLQKPMDLQEFYVWLGCMFFMLCYIGIDNRKDWWLTNPINMNNGAPFCLNKFITRNRFEQIMLVLKYTNKEPHSTFIDWFYVVHQMIDAFNKHYSSEYFPSWLSCLAKSMNVWMNKFFPGFMPLPRKPHPFGNKYHLIANRNKGRCIMWRVCIVGGKDWTKLPN